MALASHFEALENHFWSCKNVGAIFLADQLLLMIMCSATECFSFTKTHPVQTGLVICQQADMKALYCNEHIWWQAMFYNLAAHLLVNLTMITNTLDNFCNKETSLNVLLHNQLLCFIPISHFWFLDAKRKALGWFLQCV